MSATTKAVWVGPSGYVLADGTPLVQGETVVEISKGEAEASDNWKPVKASSRTSGGDE